MAANVTTNGTAAAAATHAEAPASATVKATHTATGYEWLLTCRADSVRDLVARVEYLTTWLADNGWTPATSRPAAPSSTATADAPVCPTHGCAMKQGRRGWYCPTKILDDGGDGKPIYCKVTR